MRAFETVGLLLLRVSGELIAETQLKRSTKEIYVGFRTWSHIFFLIKD